MLYRAKVELKIRAVKDGPMKDGQRTWRWHVLEKVLGGIARGRGL
jgi:hypothetical protein